MLFQEINDAPAVAMVLRVPKHRRTLAGAGKWDIDHVSDRGLGPVRHEDESIGQKSPTAWKWDFGDGASLSTTADSTTHSFASSGSFTVRMIATNGCGKTDTLSRIVNINGTCNGISLTPAAADNHVVISPNPFVNSASVRVHLAGGFSSVKNLRLIIYDLQGRVLRQVNVDDSAAVFERGNLNSGIYFYQLTGLKEIFASGKFIIQ